MPYQLEEKIELSFDINFSQPHTICDSQLCVDRGGEVCISKEFKEYLITNNKIEKYLQRELQKNDLQWLIDSDLKIRKIFSDPKVYRLRFKEHDKIACNFMDKIFQFYQIPASRKLMQDGKPFVDSFPNNPKYQDLASNLYEQLFVNKILWGSTLKNFIIQNFERYFLHLCENSRKRSTSDIYRLFDIANKYDDSYQIRLSNFLALLFALGHGNSRNKEPESISEFVSHFEFFQAFTIDSEKFYTQVAKKETEFNSVKRAILDNYVFLASDEGFKKAKEVWGIYYENCEKLFKEGINFDSCITDEEFIRSLKGHLACTSSPFPVNFSSFHSAAYHSFKHKDLCKVPAEDLQVCSYLELIREVVLNGTALPTRPDQFGKGKLFTFEQKRAINNKIKDVSVYILKGHQRSTFLLSCH